MSDLAFSIKRPPGIRSVAPATLKAVAVTSKVIVPKSIDDDDCVTNTVDDEGSEYRIRSVDSLNVSEKLPVVS